MTRFGCNEHVAKKNESMIRMFDAHRKVPAL